MADTAVPSRTISSQLDSLPVSRAHRRAVRLVGIGLFFDLFDVFLAGVLSTVLTNAFGLSKTVVPVLLGSSFLGMFLGAMGSGAIADRFGRKPAFLANLGIYSLFTLFGAFSGSAAMLVAMRFLAGIGIGGELPLSDAYLSELLPARERGRLIARAYTIGLCGVPAVGFLARVLTPLEPLGIAGWRWLFLAGSLGGWIVWALRRGLPESPRWLENQGRWSEAAAVAGTLGAELVPGGAAQKQAKPPFRVLFTARYRRRTLMLYVFQIFQTVGYYGFGSIVPLILAAKGFSVLSSLTYTGISTLGYPLGSALSLPIVERVDRKWLIVFSAAAMAIFGLALGFSTATAAIAIFGVLYTAVSNVFSNAFHIFQGEIFPTGVRATAAGSAYGLSRLSSAAMPFVLLPVLRSQGAGPMFILISAAMAIVILDIALLAPSTTGKHLDEIA
ncbi:MAG TPA: MFS transporter [Bryobacteraceae bacterium]|jgi:putative MFS transporter|nr:MFS transporter [Bryobacteraceae bacterium]